MPRSLGLIVAVSLGCLQAPAQQKQALAEDVFKNIQMFKASLRRA